MNEFCVAVGRPVPVLTSATSLLHSRAGAEPVALSGRDAAILSALAKPSPAGAIVPAVRARLLDGTPERLRPLAGAESPFIRAAMSLTSDGRRWRDYLTQWSDGQLAADVERLETAGWVRRFTLEAPKNAERRGIGVICGRAGSALARLALELSSSGEWDGEDVVVVSGDSTLTENAGRPDSLGTIGWAEREAYIRRTASSGVPEHVARQALSGDEQGPNIGANRNLLTLASGFSTVISIDDDVHARAYTRWGQPTRTDVTGDDTDPRQWTGGRTVAGLLRRVVPAGQTIPELLSSRLGSLFRDVTAIDPDMSWRDYETWREWPERWWDARIRVAWTGVIGHTGMGVTRRVLHLQGSSRERVIGYRELYKTVTEAGIAEVCAPHEVLSPAGFFAGGAFAYHQGALVPPFPSSGRGEEGVFSAVLRRVDPGALYRAVPAMVWHEPVQPREHGRSCVDVRLRCNHVLSSLVTEAPIPDGAAASSARMIQIGRYLEAFGSQPIHAVTEGVASLACRQLERTWAQLFQLRATYQGPEWWSRDVEETASSIGEVISPRLSAERKCRRVLMEPIQTVATRVREYGKVLQAWPEMWARRHRGEFVELQHLNR